MAALAVLLGERPAVGGGGLEPKVAGFPEDLGIQPVFIRELPLEIGYRELSVKEKITRFVHGAHFSYRLVIGQLLLRRRALIFIMGRGVEFQLQVRKRLVEFLFDDFQRFVIRNPHNCWILGASSDGPGEKRVGFVIAGGDFC